MIVFNYICILEWIILVNLTFSFVIFFFTLITAITTLKLKPKAKFYNSNLPTLTIIIPSRNESRIIKRCLESILKQKYPRLNVHIAINNSLQNQKDKMISIVRDYPEIFSYKDYGNMSREWLSGKSWVLNEVLLNFPNLGEYILFLDADVELQSKFALATILNVYLKKKKISIISLLPKFKCNSLTERLVLHMVPSTLSLAGFLNNLFYKKNQNPNFSNLSGWFLFFKKSELDEINNNINSVGLKSLKNCPFSDDIAIGRLFILNNKKIANFFGGNIIENDMFSTSEKAIIGMRRYGSNTYGAMSPFYKLLGCVLIISKVFPYIVLSIILFLFPLHIRLNSIIFNITLIVVGFSLISEYYILHKCNVKGILQVLLIPVSLFFYLWVFITNIKKKPLDFLDKYHTDIR